MEDKVLIFFSVAYVVVCAAFNHWAAKEEKTNPPAKCREPFPSWVPNDLTKKAGDALASKQVWWLWQGLTGLAGVVAILTEIPLLLLAASTSSTQPQNIINTKTSSQTRSEQQGGGGNGGDSGGDGGRKRKKNKNKNKDKREE